MRRAAAVALVATVAGCSWFERDPDLDRLQRGALTFERQDLGAFAQALDVCRYTAREELRDQCAARDVELAELARAASSCLPRGDRHPGCDAWWSEVGRPQLATLGRLVDLDQLTYQRPSFWSGAGPLVPWGWAERRAWLAPYLPTPAGAAGAAGALAAAVAAAAAARAGLRRARQAAQQAAQRQHAEQAQRERQRVAAERAAHAERERVERAERERIEHEQAAAEAAAAAAAERERAAAAEAQRERIEASRRQAQADSDLFGP